MRSPALALGWELWARNRRGLLAVLALVVVEGVGAQAALFFGGGLAVEVAGVSLWLDLFVYLYLLSVFGYSDIAPGGKARGFPPHLFVLPVRTSLLVGLPMLGGALAVLALYVTVFVVADAHSLNDVGVIKTLRSLRLEPGFFLAAFLACTQALGWTLVRSALVRIAMVVVGLPSAALIIVFAKLLIPIDWSGERWYESRLIWLCCLLIVCAYAVAVIGVTLDRRGDRFDWAALGNWLLRAVPAGSGRRRPFASPAAAQDWLEVRQHARLLPALVALFFAVLLWSTLLPFSETDVARVLGAFVGVPAVAGFFVGFGMGKSSFWARDLQLSPFAALRPLSCTALARAKLRAAAFSALLTWSAIPILAPMWAVLSGYAGAARTVLDTWFGVLPAWELALLVPVALVGLVGLTWLQLVAGMCLSLTGRSAVVNGVVLLYGAVGTALIGLAIWTDVHPASRDTVLVIVWCLGGALGVLKLGALIWTRKRFGSQPDRTMPRLALVWLVVAGCLVVSIEAAWPEPAVPPALIALYLVLALPLARLIALPAAVAWNRHR